MFAIVQKCGKRPQAARFIHRNLQRLQARPVHKGAELQHRQPRRHGGIRHRTDEPVEKPQVPAGIHLLNDQPVRPGTVKNSPNDLFPGKGDVRELPLPESLRKTGQIVLRSKRFDIQREKSPLSAAAAVSCGAFCGQAL